MSLWVLLWFALCQKWAGLLGHDDYFVRESATQFLLSSYPLSAKVVVGAANQNDPEVCARAQRILSRAGHGLTSIERQKQAVLACLAHGGYHAWPWMDSLPQGYDDRTSIIFRYLEKARSEVPEAIRGAPNWPEYRRATELYATDLLKAGQSIESVGLLLSRMIDGDRAQWERSQRQWCWCGVLP